MELAKIEPRLLKKISVPFVKILQGNPAKSVEFEIIRSICVIYPESEEMIRLALSKLHAFLDSHDPNRNAYSVKYLGLVALHQLIQIYPSIIDEYRIFTLEALQSRDITIRLKALSLLKITTTPATLQETVANLLKEIENPSSASIKEELISCCLYLLSCNQYELVEDFKWMFEVLLRLVALKTSSHEAQLSSIMLDVVLRVEEMREEACEVLMGVLEQFDSLRTERCEALTALIFIIGEFCGCIRHELLVKALQLLTRERWDVIAFHESVYNALSSAVFKISLRLKQSELDEACVRKIRETSTQIEHMEAQERALMYLNILNSCEKESISAVLLPFLPIHPSAQSLLSPPQEILVAFEVDNGELVTVNENGSMEYHYFRDEDFGEIQSTEEEKKIAKMRIKEKQMQDPFYIKPKKGKKKKGKRSKKTEEAAGEQVSVKEEPVEKKAEQKKYSINRTEPLLPS